MLEQKIAEREKTFVFWVFVHLIAGLVFGMRNSNNSDGQKSQNRVVSRSAKSSFRAISSYLRIVSSGASTVARSAASVASSIVERVDDSSLDQVLWAGFDKLEGEGDVTRQVLLLGYRSGFQVWDVDEADNVRDLVSRYDGPVSFMQMLPRPIKSERLRDKYAEVRPLLVTCSDGSLSGGAIIQDGLPTNGTIPNYHDSGNDSIGPTVVRFYSLKSQSYVHVLKFRSVIYSVRSSSRVVAICQAAQIHCIDAATLEREYAILTNPIGTGYPSTGSIGFGPLAVGPRWLAYSGSPVVVSNSGRVSPQQLSPSLSFSGFASNGSRVAHYAKEYAKVSSKQLAERIVTLGDIGYKKLSRYYSELLPDSQNSLQSASAGGKGNGTVSGLLPDTDNVGMVIVRDIVSKGVVAQLRAHESPISALCFDPSGVLLVTASVQGHNINVFKIMPGSSAACDASTSYVHLYILQRGITNAVIQDISFSNDSNWIMISSSRGTSHLFAINPSGGSVYFQSADTSFSAKHNGSGFMTKPGVRWPPNSGVQLSNQQNLCASGPPVTLSVVSRIRNGNNGWRGHVSSAAAAATGRMNSLSGAIASSFHNSKGNGDLYVGGSSSKMKYHLLVFSPTGCMIQYALRESAGLDVRTGMSGLSTAYDSVPDGDAGLVVEAIQKWNICQKQIHRDQEDNLDIYGENGASDSHKIYPEEMNGVNCFLPEARGSIEKTKVNLEDKHHMYISEAELQMHPPRIPLWAKPEIYFQSMMMEGIKVADEVKVKVEIERIPTRMIEARSKHLIPAVFDHLQSPKPQQPRVPGMNNNTNGRLLHQRSAFSENGRLSSRISSASLEFVTDSRDSGPGQNSDTGEKNGWDSPQMPVGAKGYVNNSDSLKTKKRLDIVNNSESLRMEAQLEFVNNNIEDLKVENHFEDEGDEFD